jgi:ribose 1,5-bisphosphate isomerase
MDKEVRRIIADIKSLKIQGARNVAKESLNALIIEAKGDHVAKPSCLVTNVALAASSLAKSRPTEPMMRNLLGESVAFLKSEHAKKQSAPELKKAFISHVNDSIARMEEDAKKLASYGAKLIPDGALVLTHCHSSSSTKILIQAKKMRKKFSVVVPGQEDCGGARESRDRCHAHGGRGHEPVHEEGGYRVRRR